MISIHCSDGQSTHDGHRQFDNIRAVLLDKDGTLANVGSFLTNLARQRTRLIDARIPGVQEPLLMAMGISADGIDPAGLMAVGTRWETEVAAAAYVAETGRGWREAIALVHTSFMEADRGWGSKAGHTPPFEDAVPCLQRLYSSGLRLGIASADTPENVKEFVDHYNLSSYFHLVMGSDREVVKPTADFLTQACDELEVAPSQLLVVGDSLADIDLARQADTAGCVLVGRGGGDSSTLAQADVVIPSLAQLQPSS
ncbi:MAG: HAD family hydrolase [Elainellaceae cyanobacterium]